jgi:hypothetical protein
MYANMIEIIWMPPEDPQGFEEIQLEDRIAVVMGVRTALPV